MCILLRIFCFRKCEFYDSVIIRYAMLCTGNQLFLSVSLLKSGFCHSTIKAGSLFVQYLYKIALVHISVV